MTNFSTNYTERPLDRRSVNSGISTSSSNYSYFCEQREATRRFTKALLERAERTNTPELNEASKDVYSSASYLNLVLNNNSSSNSNSNSNSSNNNEAFTIEEKRIETPEVYHHNETEGKYDPPVPQPIHAKQPKPYNTFKPKARCSLCGSVVNKSFLANHKETEKCRRLQLIILHDASRQVAGQPRSNRAARDRSGTQDRPSDDIAGSQRAERTKYNKSNTVTNLAFSDTSYTGSRTSITSPSTTKRNRAAIEPDSDDSDDSDVPLMQKTRHRKRRNDGSKLPTGSSKGLVTVKRPSAAQPDRFMFSLNLPRDKFAMLAASFDTSRLSMNQEKDSVNVPVSRDLHFPIFENLSTSETQKAQTGVLFSEAIPRVTVKEPNSELVPCPRSTPEALTAFIAPNPAQSPLIETPDFPKFAISPRLLPDIPDSIPAIKSVYSAIVTEPPLISIPVSAKQLLAEPRGIQKPPKQTAPSSYPMRPSRPPKGVPEPHWRQTTEMALASPGLEECVPSPSKRRTTGKEACMSIRMLRTPSKRSFASPWSARWRTARAALKLTEGVVPTKTRLNQSKPLVSVADVAVQTDAPITKFEDRGTSPIFNGSHFADAAVQAEAPTALFEDRGTSPIPDHWRCQVETVRSQTPTRCSSCCHDGNMEEQNIYATCLIAAIDIMEDFMRFRDATAPVGNIKPSARDILKEKYLNRIETNLEELKLRISYSDQRSSGLAPLR